MPLSLSTLSNALKAVFESMPATASDAANALAGAYADYATDGKFGASTFSVTGGMRSALASTILGAIGTPASGLPATIAAAWAAGVAAFWAGVPVSGTQAGMVTGCPGAASLTASLTAVFANLANTSATCAAAMATALHGATASTTATVAPPAGTTLPIT